MKSLRFLGCGCVLAAAFAVFAQQPAPPATGAVLLLSNDRVLEGDIVRVLDQYRVRQGTSETVVSGQRVKRLCADWDDAFAYLRSQAKLDDPEERLRLARWCQLHGLTKHALAEAQAAALMRPGHAESKHLAELLRRTLNPPAPPATPRPPALTTPSVVAAAAPAAPALDVSADSMTLFTAKVQPILLNVCARCHLGQEGGAFRLQRAADDGSRAVTQRNLAATLAQLNLERPEASPLLTKAVSAHGQATQAPLRDRRAPAFVTLQQWAERVAAQNPHLREPRLATTPAFGAGPAVIAVAPPAATPRSQGGTVISRPLGRAEESEAPPTVSPVTTSPLPQPAASATKKDEGRRSTDEHDPELFNRRK